MHFWRTSVLLVACILSYSSSQTVSKQWKQFFPTSYQDNFITDNPVISHPENSIIRHAREARRGRERSCCGGELLRKITEEDQQDIEECRDSNKRRICEHDCIAVRRGWMNSEDETIDRKVFTEYWGVEKGGWKEDLVNVSVEHCMERMDRNRDRERENSRSDSPCRRKAKKMMMCVERTALKRCPEEQRGTDDICRKFYERGDRESRRRQRPKEDDDRERGSNSEWEREEED